MKTFKGFESISDEVAREITDKDFMRAYEGKSSSSERTEDKIRYIYE